MKRKLIPIFSVLLIFAASALIIFTSPGRPLAPAASSTMPLSSTGFYFDTVISVTIYDTDTLGTEKSREVLSQCFSICEFYENMFSRTKPGSDIYAINTAKGAAVSVHEETYFLLEKALSYCESTNGLLDITIAPVSDLWNFTDKAKSGVPDHAILQERLSHVNYKNILLKDNTVTLTDPEAALDLGCCAKGYIADKLKDYLKEQGITSALINLGGNIQTLGEKPNGDAFLLGIQKPFDENGAAIATLEVRDLSLVSSGIYQRCFEENGQLYHHLLDVQNGFPKQNDLLGVTILSPSSTDADFLSTAVYFMGLEQGLTFIEKMPDTEAVFITKDYSLHTTSGLSSLVKTP